MQYASIALVVSGSGFVYKDKHEVPLILFNNGTQSCFWVYKFNYHPVHEKLNLLYNSNYT